MTLYSLSERRRRAIAAVASGVRAWPLAGSGGRRRLARLVLQLLELPATEPPIAAARNAPPSDFSRLAHSTSYSVGNSAFSDAAARYGFLAVSKMASKIARKIEVHKSSKNRS